MRQVTDRLLGYLETVGMAMAALAMFVMMIGISADAFGRYFLSAPLTGQYEFTTLYLMVILTFMGLAKTQALGGHIRIPILAGKLSALPGDPAQRFTALAAAIGFGIMTYVSGGEALSRIAARTTTFGSVQFPTYLSYCWVPVGTGLLCLRLLHQVVWPVRATGTGTPLDAPE